MKLDKKFFSSLKSILEWADVSLGVGLKARELIKNRQKGNGKNQKTSQPSGDVKPGLVSPEIFVIYGGDRGLDKILKKDKSAQFVKEACESAISKAAQGDIIGRDQEIDRARRIFRNWFDKNYPSRNLIEQYLACDDPEGVLPLLKDSNPVAYNELKDMLPFLEIILKYKSQS